ncbi:conserved hypothetical protein [Arthrobacter sp. 9V]|uniref:hypothetical protein n=1 Tax=Arthrobacter sp. 9V TaxID=2653132 RepID=UPI0012F17853|nr:hypothetical protein [Arthrobacter sp. 9V]VXC25624.1 conserved hypothetical protein [Arthrobacter sp. 9V]
MTSRNNEREVIVDELLLDADATDSPDVRRALLSMGSFANLAAPTPGAELSAMLAGPHDEVSKRRWRHKHRTAVVSVAVVAAMGLGVSGVAAASSGFTRNPSFMDELLGNVRPQPAAAPVLPIPDAPRVFTKPAPIVDPSAIPPVPGAGSLPVAGSVASGQTQAQSEAPAPVKAQAQAPAPAQAELPAQPQVPGAVIPAQKTPAQNTPAQDTPAQPNTAPIPARNPQSKPGSGKEEKEQAAKPDASLQGAGKPAKTSPGAEESKPGHLPPGLSRERADQQLERSDQQFQGSVDTWKKWLKR